MNRDYHYKTVYKHGIAELIERKSKFISNVKPVYNEKEAINFISEMKSKYWNASHNVYAYSIGKNIQRYSDDGEPSGTAGIPSLEIIKKEELEDVVLVVTRYYGGIQLGAGGLIRTYAKSAKEGVIAAKIIDMKLCNIVSINITYDLLGKLESAIINSDNYIDEILYEEDVTLRVWSYIEQAKEFNNNIIEITQGRAKIKKLGEKYIAVDKKGKVLKTVDI